MLAIYTKADVAERKLDRMEVTGLDWHIGQLFQFGKNESIDDVAEIFADGDEKAVIDQFIQNIPKCDVVGIRAFYWYGDTAKTICAFIQCYGYRIEKIDVDNGKNMYWINPNPR